MWIQQIDCGAGTTCAQFPLEKRKVAKKTFSHTGGGGAILLILLGAWTGSVIQNLGDANIAEPAYFLAWSGVGLLLLAFIGIGIGILYQIFYFRFY